MVLGLTDLNDDVIVRIAYECTASDVLALERTCKCLRSLFSEPIRPLWLQFLQELDDFHAPDLPPHIVVDSLPSSELKRLVFRAVKGYRNWNSPFESGPRISRRRIIDLKNKGGLLGDLKQSLKRHREIVKIVPNGKYVCVLWSEGYFQCWNAEKNEVVWTYPQLGTFAEIQVLAYDVEYDVSSGQFFIVVAGTYLEPTNFSEPCFIESFWLNPGSRRATKIKGRSMCWQVPSLLRICGDAIIMSGTHCVITNKKLERCFALRDVDILGETMSVSDGYFIFVGKEPYSEEYMLFAMDAQRVFVGHRAPKIPLAAGPLNFSLSIKSDLNNFVLKAPIPTLPERLASVHLVSCTPSWHGSSVTTIYVMGKLSSGHSNTLQSTCTRFSLFSFQLAMRTSCNISNTVSFSLPPSLTLSRIKPPVSIPLSHPYCTEEVHSLSHAGRGILASVNKLHRGVRYYAFSIEKLFEGDVRKSLGPILFGRDRVAPSEVSMEKYSGALAFVSKDERSLIIQYYD